MGRAPLRSPTVGTVTDTGRRRRRDAERNREAILAAARDAFSEAGLAAGVDSIARRAGVGPATLYRHFPSKSDLVAAVLEGRIAELSEVIQGASRITEPEAAVRELVHRVVDAQARDRSFRDVLAWHDAESIREVPALEQLGVMIGEIFERARAAGAMRADAQLEDLLLLLTAFDGVTAHAATVAPDSMHRLADVALDGLLGSATPLEGDPVAFEDLRAVAAAGRGLPPRPSS
jgi:AcrR family transcriptional regulator